MAHKIRVPLYRRLRDLLEATGKTYSVYVSTALHENTSFDDSFVVRFEELQSIFNGRIYFMGYLSDTAVFNHLLDCTFLAAFFEKGLRANNTTVNAAMEVGCAVITNLDEHSPDGSRPHEERHRHQPLRSASGRARKPSASAAPRARSRTPTTGGISWSRSCGLWSRQRSVEAPASRARDRTSRGERQWQGHSESARTRSAITRSAT